MGQSRFQNWYKTRSGLVPERLRHDGQWVCWYFIAMPLSAALNSKCPLRRPGEDVTESWPGIVDIGGKPVVAREAIATGLLVLTPQSIDLVENGRSPKGDVREASTIAAIQAVKETPRTLPHCHPIPVEGCTVDWSLEDGGLRCTVSVRAHWSTRVEMEALCGVSAGLLCAWDMLKPVEKDGRGQYPSAKIDGIRVVKKKKSDPQD